MATEYKYDVFISYSRKDYVDENKEVIPGNIVTQIKETLDANDISYWMDEKGIYSGDEFAKIIAKLIRQSKIFLFVSTENSNASEWTSDEIATARMYKKKIIPFKYDDSFYNEEVIIFIAKLDFIDYQSNTEQALNKLVNSIKKYLADLEDLRKREEELQLKRKQEEEERRIRAEEEARKEKVRGEIKQKAQDVQHLFIQQQTIIQQLHTKNFSIGNETKECPVCKKVSPIDASFCDRCGFNFPLLYSIDGNENYPFDSRHLVVAKANYDAIAYVEKEKTELKEKIDALTISFDKISKECEQHLKTIKRKEVEAESYRQRSSSLSRELADTQSQFSELKSQLDKQKKELLSRIEKLQQENTKLTKHSEQSEQEQKRIEQVYKEAQEKIKELEEKLAQSDSLVALSDLYDVVLLSPGKEQLAVAKFVKDTLNISLKEAYDFVTSAPNVLIATEITMKEAEKLAKSLNMFNASYKITPHNQSFKKDKTNSTSISNTSSNTIKTFRSKAEVFEFVKGYTKYPSSLKKSDKINVIIDKTKLCVELEESYGIGIWTRIPQIQTIGNLVDNIWDKSNHK